MNFFPTKSFAVTMIVGLLWSVSFSAYTNNIVVSNVKLTGQNTTDGFTLVQFDIGWENSWRISSGPSNWDAAWIFVKFRKKAELTWNHATLNWVDGTGTGDGHTLPANSAISSSDDSDTGGAYGVFLYRDGDFDQGSVSYPGVQLRWNYGVNGLMDADSVEVRVYAIEMVYVPEGSFYLGSGGTEVGSFTEGSWTSGATIPYQITSENALTMGASAGNLWGTSTSGDSFIGAAGTLAAEYPKGYRAYYSMKYEISQDQYVAFLNVLTRGQQDARTATDLDSAITAVTNRWVMNGNSIQANRNGIRCDATIAVDVPIKFYCDLNGNDTGNEPGDGLNIACNYLSWADLAAYLDWAALRPMTELEYEKSSRGFLPPVVDEYAWGNTTITQATGINNGGQSIETTSNIANSTHGNGTEGPVNAPMRVGNFGQGVNTRPGVGAGYFGILELSGNLRERVVNASRVPGRAFTGLHGDGTLTDTGYANVSNWPENNAVGIGFRGGSFWQGTPRLRVSDRASAGTTNTVRGFGHGGRGVRSAP